MAVVCNNTLCVGRKSAVHKFVVIRVRFDCQPVKINVNFFNEWAISQGVRKLSATEES